MAFTNKDWAALSDSAIVQAIGEFIKGTRLNRNITQADLATQAGLNRWTLSQIENGESINLSSLIQILRALDQLNLLQGFELKNELSPLELAKMQKKKRERARGSDSTDQNGDLGW
ncbi:helix-turn-helix domain-containing protein [Algoriphagus namhaensis]